MQRDEMMKHGVKELKAMARERRVDVTSCVEKDEIVAKLFHHEEEERRVATLANLPCLDLLKELRTVKEAEARRDLTKKVHTMLLRQWEADFRYRGMARHLIEDVHSSFRDGFGQVLRLIDQGAEWQSLFRRYNESLHHHHSLEDKMWFPRLRSKHPEMGPEIDVLEEDHREIVKLESRVKTGAVDACKEFIAHLFDHLCREEMITIPFLLDGTGGLG